MDSATIFIIFISVFVFGILAYLELKSRRNRREEPLEKGDKQ